MRLLAVLGVLLIVLGIIALAVPGFTYFTTEHVVNTNYFSISVERPHTIVFNPIVGIVAVVAGIVLVIVGRQPASL